MLSRFDLLRIRSYAKKVGAITVEELGNRAPNAAPHANRERSSFQKFRGFPGKESQGLDTTFPREIENPRAFAPTKSPLPLDASHERRLSPTT